LDITGRPQKDLKTLLLTAFRALFYIQNLVSGHSFITISTTPFFRKSGKEKTGIIKAVGSVIPVSLNGDKWHNYYLNI